MRILFLIAALLAAGFVRADSDRPKIAVVAGSDCVVPALAGRTAALKSELESRLASAGFAVVDLSMQTKTLGEFLSSGGLPKAEDGLFSKASALRVCEMSGADCLLVAKYSQYLKAVKKFSGYGIKTENAVYTLGANYAVYAAGESVSGGAVEASKTVRASESGGEIPEDVLGELVADVSRQMAAAAASGKSALVKKQASALCEVAFEFSVEDLFFPQIKSENGQYVLTGDCAPANIGLVNAQIDGVARPLGEKTVLSKGLHKLKIRQSDIADFDADILVSGEAGQKFAFRLSLDAAARARMRGDMEFLQSLKDRSAQTLDRRIITEAEAERLRGLAKKFGQSGIKIDAKEFPEVKLQSIFGQ